MNTQTPKKLRTFFFLIIATALLSSTSIMASAKPSIKSQLEPQLRTWNTNNIHLVVYGYIKNAKVCGQTDNGYKCTPTYNTNNAGFKDITWWFRVGKELTITLKHEFYGSKQCKVTIPANFNTNKWTTIKPKFAPSTGKLTCTVINGYKNSPDAENIIQLTRLPWKNGETWKYRQTEHGNNFALDFATTNGKPGEVYAADSGKVVWAKETCILIRRSDGVEMGYQHIRTKDIKKFKSGQSVKAGQFIGYTTLEKGCNGYSTGHHLHFYVQGVYGYLDFGSMIGLWRIEKYTYVYQNGSKEAASKLRYVGFNSAGKNKEATVCLSFERSCKHDLITQYSEKQSSLIMPTIMIAHAGYLDLNQETSFNQMMFRKIFISA
ncbi:M23 family metallopeptidase [bacterium]|nr:M23 family metallopeptidase [bacterium]